MPVTCGTLRTSSIEWKIGSLRGTSSITYQEVPLCPRVVCAPAGAVRLAADAPVEHVASGDVSIGPLGRWQFRGIALFATQHPEAAEEILPKLSIRIAS
jgi:hypothetical protein